jgi:hypothetical protein
MSSWPEGRAYLDQQRRRLPTHKFRRLATDPQADVSAELQPELADQVGRHPEHGSEVKLSIRERHEPELNGVPYGEVERTRRHKIIG